MPLTRNTLYALLSIACSTGILWLWYNLSSEATESPALGVCIFKQVTHVPCPSCGSTRAAMALLQGHILTSLMINPLGVLIVSIMLFIPCWIIFDLLTNRDSLFRAYLKMEQALQRPPLAAVLIVLLIINWVWNIFKGV